MINKDLGKKYLNLALSHGGDFAELFFERTATTQYQLILT